jgi:hypothetical protein
MTQLTASILETAAATGATCACDDPIPVQHAKRKGAAVTICQRCGLRVRLRLR